MTMTKLFVALLKEEAVKILAPESITSKVGVVGNVLRATGTCSTDEASIVNVLVDNIARRSRGSLICNGMISSIYLFYFLLNAHVAQSQRFEALTFFHELSRTQQSSVILTKTSISKSNLWRIAF